MGGRQALHEKGGKRPFQSNRLLVVLAPFQDKSCLINNIAFMYIQDGFAQKPCPKYNFFFLDPKKISLFLVEPESREETCPDFFLLGSF